MEQLASFAGNCPGFRHLLYELTLSRISLNNSLKPYGALCLHHTAHCTDSMSVERVGQGEVGGVTAVCCVCGSCKAWLQRSHDWQWVGQFPAWLHE